ncbi:MAG: hypothetical protein GY746_13710 [Gammaproteobacteria bacterium]|nr:hypothetical protein [Gammaproteobacteria bacterium]
MPVQTTYDAEHIPGYEGQRRNLGITNVTSRVAEDTDIPFGRAIVQGTADNQGKLPTATGQVFLGISEMTTAWAETYGATGDLHVYSQYREVNIIDFGEIYAYTEQSTVPGDPVYFRHTADTAPLDVVGRFRTDASGGDADLIQGAAWLTTVAAGGRGIIKLNAPGTGVLIAADSSETITATTAVVGIDTSITYVDTTLGAMAASLADGTEGQLKRILMTVDNGDCIITPANLALGATLRLTEVFDYVDLQFSGTSWKEVGRGNRATVTILASGAVPLDIDILLIDTVSTTAQALTLADGYTGQRLTTKMTVDAADSVLQPTNFLDGVSITYDDAGDSAELLFDGTNWGVIGTPTATVA